MNRFPEWCADEEAIARRLIVAPDPSERASLFAALSSYSCALLRHARASRLPSIDESEVARALEWLRRPVFVCGHHRSGTTLLQELLDGHPQLMVIPTEITYFTSFASVAVAKPAQAALDAFVLEWIARFVDPNGKRHFHLGRASAIDNPSLEFARRLLAWQAELARRTAVPAHLVALLALAAAYRDIVKPGSAPLRWVEKTPLNEVHVTRLGVLRDARFIQMVRDPVATLRSQLADLQGASVCGVDPAEQAWRIARSFSLARRNRALDAERYLVVRYEHLTAQPTAAMERVREFLALADDEALSRPTVLGQAVGSNSAFAPGAAGVIHSSVQNGALMRSEERLLATFCGDQVREFGYQQDAMAVGVAPSARRVAYLLRMTFHLAMRTLRRQLQLK